MTKSALKSLVTGVLVAGGIFSQIAVSALPAQAGGIGAKSFTPSCAAGFEVFAVKKSIVAGVQVVTSFKCRTAWFMCPNIPSKDETLMRVDVKRKGSGDANVKTRVIYECFGHDIAG